MPAESAPLPTPMPVYLADFTPEPHGAGSNIPSTAIHSTWS